jgi:small subunit ribosomal protein S1
VRRAAESAGREEPDVSQQDDDFAAMLEASLKPRRIERGETVEGRIVGIGQDVAFVDVGGKGEATIDLAELRDADGALEVAAGDRITATVVSTTGGLTLSRRLLRGAASAGQLEGAFHSGLPVEGRVEAEVKGGYEVRVAGQRAFCPFSQIDLHRTEGAAHIGQVYRFRITEYKEGGRSIVVSRRAVLEEEQRANAAELRRLITAGAVMTGRVTSVRDFGAFVDLGSGVQGLLHVSEMGWGRVSDPSQIVRPGDAITVRILSIDDDRQKIALGLKQLTADPWSTVQARYEVGEVYPGRVTRLAEFGAFVELEPGIEALAHASTFPPSGRPRAWRTLVAVGATARFEILGIDVEKRRMGVGLVPEGAARAGIAARAQAEAAAAEAEDVRAYAAREDAAQADGLSSLADKLRGALTDRRK